VEEEKIANHGRSDERRQRKQEYKQKLAQAAEISTAELLAKRSALSRLWAPTLFALVVMAASVIFAESYEPPALSMRLLPSIPPAVATCGAIVLMNLALFIAWRSPQAWRTMNRYFLLSSGHPNSISTLGSIFSHQSFGHFAKTMALMMVIGIPGTFLCPNYSIHLLLVSTQSTKTDVS